MLVIFQDFEPIMDFDDTRKLTFVDSGEGKENYRMQSVLCHGSMPLCFTAAGFMSKGDRKIESFFLSSFLLPPTVQNVRSIVKVYT